jgi:hypothetical protein
LSRWSFALLLLFQLTLTAGGEWYIVGNRMASADYIETRGIASDASGDPVPGICGGSAVYRQGPAAHCHTPTLRCRSSRRSLPHAAFNIFSPGPEIPDGRSRNRAVALHDCHRASPWNKHSLSAISSGRSKRRFSSANIIGAGRFM